MKGLSAPIGWAWGVSVIGISVAVFVLMDAVKACIFLSFYYCYYFYPSIIGVHFLLWENSRVQSMGIKGKQRELRHIASSLLCIAEHNFVLYHKQDNLNY